MPDAHARFAPSSSDRWIACPGSVSLTERLLSEGKIPKDTSNDASIKGTLIHEKCEQHLIAGTDPRQDKEQLYHKTKNAAVVVEPEEWHPHAISYIEFIRDQLELMALSTGVEPVLKIEDRVTIKDDVCWGSVDAHAYAANWLLVDDLKTGYHIVSPEGNTQFMTYAVGIMNAHDWKFEEIYLGRSQIQDEDNPNALWKVTKDELRDHWSVVLNAIGDAISDDPHFEQGSHCKWCRAASHCPLKYESAVSIFDDEECTTVTPVEALTEDQIQKLMTLRPIIEQYFKSVEQFITERLNQGIPFPGYKLVAGRSSRKWNPDTLDAAAKMAQDFGVDPYRPRELRTFTDIEKEMGKGAMSDFLIKPPGKPTLAKESDKRPGITTADIFNDGLN